MCYLPSRFDEINSAFLVKRFLGNGSISCTFPEVTFWLKRPIQDSDIDVSSKISLEKESLISMEVEIFDRLR